MALCGELAGRHDEEHQGERVAALGDYAGRTSVGGSFDSDFAMIFTLRDGRIVEFQEFLDVAQYNAAWAAAVAR